MKKIQKVLILSLIISASLSASAPTLKTLDLKKNNGVEITNFIKANIAKPQRPAVKNLGMLQADFDISDIEVAWKLKQAIDSKNVVVARRKKAAWKDALEKNYGEFINPDYLMKESDVKDLQLAFYNINLFMNKYVMSEDQITNDLGAAKAFRAGVADFIERGGRHEPFESLLKDANRTITEDAKARKTVENDANKKQLKSIKEALERAEAELKDKKAAKETPSKAKNIKRKLDIKLKIKTLSQRVESLKENARNYCKKHDLSIPDWAQIELPAITINAFSKALIEIAKRDPSTVVTSDEIDDELGVD